MKIELSKLVNDLKLLREQVNLSPVSSEDEYEVLSRKRTHELVEHDDLKAFEDLKTFEPLKEDIYFDLESIAPSLVSSNSSLMSGLTDFGAVLTAFDTYLPKTIGTDLLISKHITPTTNDYFKMIEVPEETNDELFDFTFFDEFQRT